MRFQDGRDGHLFRRPGTAASAAQGVPARQCRGITPRRSSHALDLDSGFGEVRVDLVSDFNGTLAEGLRKVRVVLGPI